jgi:hypothetical protein
VLALPGGDGFDLAAYLIPALAVLVGAAAVGAAAIRWRRTRADSAPERGAPAPASAERLQSDLDRYEL